MPTAMEVAVQLPLGPLQPRRLLDVIQRLPAIEGNNPLRWLEGVTWEPSVCYDSLRLNDETDCVESELDPTVRPCIEWITQTPFRISEAMTRSTLDYTSTILGERLEMQYYRQLSAAFARELVGGTHSTIGLALVATEPEGAGFADAASTVVAGFEVLEDEIAYRLQGAVGYLHVPPGMLGRFVVECGLHLNSAGQWETPAGNIVISDAGYYNPAAPTGQAASDEANDWVYASGPVFYESTAPTDWGAAFQGVGTDSPTAWNRDTIVQYLSGYGILVFDPCPVTAVLIEYS